MIEKKIFVKRKGIRDILIQFIISIDLPYDELLRFSRDFSLFLHLITKSLILLGFFVADLRKRN